MFTMSPVVQSLLWVPCMWGWCGGTQHGLQIVEADYSVCGGTF